MNANNVLEISLAEVLNVIRPLRQDWVVRSKIIEEVQAVVNSLESLRGATVEPFGSFVSNLFTRRGDLDISIDLSLNAYMPSSGKKHKQALLGEVLKALRRKGIARRLQFIPNARVPILKFESNRQSIACDVSIDNLQGQMKSKLLFWLGRMDGRFRDMILIVKEWAKAHDINHSKTGTLNSYSLTLLVIFHFQTCAPAIFPPLKDIYPGNIIDDLKGVRADAERRVEETCIANITRFSSANLRSPNRSSLSELFISFLAKFSDINAKASELGMCTYTGQWEDVSSNTRWLPRTYALFIEDPFEQPENTARAVGASQLTRISETFRTSYLTLSTTYMDRVSLLSMLVRPQIVQRITGGAQIKRPSYNHAHEYQLNDSSSRASDSDAHSQEIGYARPRPQQQRRADGNKTTVQRRAQPNQTQSKQMWKPKADE